MSEVFRNLAQSNAIFYSNSPYIIISSGNISFFSIVSKPRVFPLNKKKNEKKNALLSAFFPR